jgi:hypothetical protein
LMTPRRRLYECRSEAVAPSALPVRNDLATLGAPALGAGPDS